MINLNGDNYLWTLSLDREELIISKDGKTLYSINVNDTSGVSYVLSKMLVDFSGISVQSSNKNNIFKVTDTE